MQYAFHVSFQSKVSDAMRVLDEAGFSETVPTSGFVLFG